MLHFLLDGLKNYMLLGPPGCRNSFLAADAIINNPPTELYIKFKKWQKKEKK